MIEESLQEAVAEARAGRGRMHATNQREIEPARENVLDKFGTFSLLYYINCEYLL